MAKRDNDAAARLLVEAALHGDTKVAKDAGVTTQTLRNYRRALSEDPELLQTFTSFSKELLTRSWADELEASLTVTITKLTEHISMLELATPESIKAITEALKALAEIAITREVLRAGEPTENQTAPAAGRTDTRGQGGHPFN